MKKAVVTLCIGDRFSELSRLSHPHIKAYANKIGADFVVISDRSFTTPVICYEKLQIKSLLQRYDRIFYVDTDVYIRSHCPDIFSIVPFGWFGAFSEGAWMDRWHSLRLGGEQFGFNKDHLRQWEKRYFNAGVMVLDKTHRNVFIAPEVFHNNFEDQTWMNIQVLTKAANRFVDIGPHFDRMSHLDWANRLESFIIHYAGGRYEEMRMDIELDARLKATTAPPATTEG